MRINLQELSKSSEIYTVLLDLTERLPSHIHESCTISVKYQIKKEDDYFLLHLETESRLPIICQRCAEQAEVPYQNEITLAVCSNHDRAEQLASLYECLESKDNSIDLAEVITDELYLYSPQSHLQVSDCKKVDNVRFESEES